MHHHGKKIWLSVLAASLIAPSVGCQSNTQTGALLGSGLGGLAGAIIGHQSGNAEKGAMIGALAGGAGGGLVGHGQDVAQERDAAVQQVAYQQRARAAEAQQRAAAARAMTNSDVIMMSQQGLPEDIIINAIQNRGGRFNTTATQIVALQQAGVSPNVIKVVQNTGGGY